MVTPVNRPGSSSVPVRGVESAGYGPQRRNSASATTTRESSCSRPMPSPPATRRTARRRRLQHLHVGEPHQPPECGRIRARSRRAHRQAVAPTRIAGPLAPDPPTGEARRVDIEDPDLCPASPLPCMQHHGHSDVPQHGCRSAFSQPRHAAHQQRRQPSPTT